MTFEQQLHALMDKHGLTYVGIAVYTLPDGTRFFGGSAHSGRITGHGDCQQGSATNALNAALSDLEGKRLKIASVDNVIPLGGLTGMEASEIERRLG